MPEFSDIVFNPTANMTDPQLVEASAGTGKTFNIQNAYLRLLLHNRLTVQQILVVTFTDAATKELRERLRNVLLECYYALHAPQQEEATGDTLRARNAIALANPTHDRQVSDDLKRHVQMALMDFDSAAIFTIHGFCKRVLERYAFECGHDPDAELMTNQSEIIREACQDWWRNNAYGKPVADRLFSSLDQLIKITALTYNHPIATMRGSAIPDTPAFTALIHACQRIVIADFRGDFSWTSAGHILKGKKDRETIDLTELIKVVEKYSNEFTDGAQQLEHMDPESASGALGLVIRSISDPQRRMDAKATAKAIKLIGEAGTEILLLAPRAVAAGNIARDIRERIRDRAALTYDAMLVNVRAVLQDKHAGPQLRALLRDEFRAALIDEFQDTDPVQYEIFWELFHTPRGSTETPSPLVFVGDPKQAIYGFRGGDIFTYYRAHDEIDAANRHSLGTNYRSEKNMVAAINELFKDRPTGEKTFINDKIPYATDLAANDVGADKELLINDARDNTPLKIWNIGNKDEAKATWSSLAACEVERLLADPAERIGGRRISPGDVAVLVATHREAEQIQQALSERGINAVRQAQGNIFDNADAQNLALLLQAMREPRRGQHIRSALATGLFPCSREQIAAYFEETQTLVTAPVAANQRQFEDWVSIFRAAGERWQKTSFMQGFQHLARETQLYQHIAGLPDGNERLSDLRHLVEVAHQTARDRRLNPTALLRWLERQLDANLRDASGEDEDTKPRIADDDDAVRIMTIFRSKGLQFPIVFVPTLWNMESKPRTESRVALKYHDTNNALILNLDTGSPDAKKIVQRETHEENIRKLYVAVTRAVNRVYLFTTDPLDAEDKAETKTALAHVLDSLPTPLHHIARDATPRAVPAASVRAGTPKPDPNTLTARPLSDGVDKTHGHESFSSLATHRATPATSLEVRDIDQDTAEGRPADAAELEPIFTIPGGAQLGECWHEIFEYIDFQASPEEIRKLTNDTLDKYRICPVPSPEKPLPIQELMNNRRAAVHQMISNTLSAKLQSGSDAPPFRLTDISMASRRSELEFNFSLYAKGGRGVDGLGRTLKELWNTAARNDEFIEGLLARSGALQRGFMTGFMDLVFEQNGKFYIVDWKSNQLNRQASGFEQDGLAREMYAHSYYLQYMIYTVALHGFLQTRLRGYDYDQHFGGVFYLFVRGMDGKSTRGIFTDRPSKELTLALADYLGGPQ